ncbi:MAG: hypothetical protein WBZ19_22580 [Chthoniobacterales bacterium]
MNARLILAGAATALGFLLCQTATSLPSSAIVRFPLTIIHEHLYVPMSLLGQTKTHWWLVDTGSPWSLVDVDQAKQLVRSVATISEGSTIVAGQKAKLLVDIGTIVDGYPMGGFDFFEASLSGMIEGNRNTSDRSSDRFEAGGVLGVNFLVRHDAILNFRSQLLLLRATSTPRQNRAGFEGQGYTDVPIHVTGIGRIEAIGSVGATSYSFLIDSGSPQTVLQSTIKESSWLFGWKSDSVYFAVGQSSRVTSGRLPGFRLGAQDLSGNVVHFANIPNLQTGFSHPLGGIIGEDFLSTYQAILDIGGGALYLKPGPGK